MTQATSPKLRRKDIYYFDLVVFQVRSHTVRMYQRAQLIRAEGGRRTFQSAEESLFDFERIRYDIYSSTWGE